MIKEKNKYREYLKQYYLDNREKILLKTGAYHKKNPPTKEKQKQYRLKRKYNMSVEEYKNLLESRNYTCEICGEQEENTTGISPVILHIDHCHNTGKIRGMLCKFCNNGLGHFKDDVETMKKAITYLEKSREVNQTF